MFDVRQAAHGASASSRPHAYPSADTNSRKPDRPATHRDGGGRFGGRCTNTDIIHVCLNGTYYLVTYDGFRCHPRAPRVPPGPGRRAYGCFGMSMEKGAQAPVSDTDAVHCRPKLRRDAESKLRRGGGS